MRAYLSVTGPNRGDSSFLTKYGSHMTRTAANATKPLDGVLLEIIFLCIIFVDAHDG
jgi:hypothetical protein